MRRFRNRDAAHAAQDVKALPAEQPFDSG
jgi:hypothetical protein